MDTALYFLSATWAALCVFGIAYLLRLKHQAGEALNFRIVDIYTVALISLPWLVQSGRILSMPQSDNHDDPHEASILLGLMLISQLMGVVFEWALRKPEECKVRSHLWHIFTTLRGGGLGLAALAGYWFLSALLMSFF